MRLLNPKGLPGSFYSGQNVCLVKHMKLAGNQREQVCVCVLFIYHEVLPVDNASCKWVGFFVYLAENREIILL